MITREQVFEKVEASRVESGIAEPTGAARRLRSASSAGNLFAPETKGENRNAIQQRQFALQKVRVTGKRLLINSKMS